MDKIIKQCSVCGCDVEIFHKKRLEQKNIFCGRKCLAEFNKKPPNTHCLICQKPIKVKNSHLKKIKGGGVCCSHECNATRNQIRYLGSDNPNHRYDADYSCIYNLDSFGSYILGMIWSDGHVNSETNSIIITQKDNGTLMSISNKIFNKDLVKKRKDKDISYLSFHSKELVSHLLSLGGIKAGKKADFVSLPNIEEKNIWPFICGYFDGDGGFKYNYKYPEISIASNSFKILQQIAEYWGVNYTGKDKIYAGGYKALDICGKMYESSPIRFNRKYDYYLQILNWEPRKPTKKYKEEYFKYQKLSPEALPPEKKRVTDSGYDVHAIEFYPLNEKIGLYMADMRLAIEPSPGWYFDLVGRSSLPQNNLHFTGGVGIIDRSYVGSLKMIMQKIDIDKPLPQTPFKCGQLIPRKIIHLEFKEVDSFSDSSRGDNGFGSTGV